MDRAEGCRGTIRDWHPWWDEGFDRGTRGDKANFTLENEQCPPKLARGSVMVSMYRSFQQS